MQMTLSEIGEIDWSSDVVVRRVGASDTADVQAMCDLFARQSSYFRGNDIVGLPSSVRECQAWMRKYRPFDRAMYGAFSLLGGVGPVDGRVENQRCVGFLGHDLRWEIEPQTQRPQPIVTSFYGVDPGCQGRGICTRMLEQALRDCLASPPRVIGLRLQTRLTNVGSRKVAERFGLLPVPGSEVEMDLACTGNRQPYIDYFAPREVIERALMGREVERMGSRDRDVAISAFDSPAQAVTDQPEHEISYEVSRERMRA